MEALFQRFDVLAGPSVGEPAWPLDANLEKVGDQPDPLGALGNLCGLPAINVPCGFTADKLPIGLQFVGRALDDHAVVAAGMALQSSPTGTSVGRRPDRRAPRAQIATTISYVHQPGNSSHSALSPKNISHV